MDSLKSFLSNFQIGVLGICILLGLVLSTQIAAETFTSIKKDQTMRVTGAVSKIIESDYAEWDGQFTCRSEVLQDAYACIKRNAASVKTFLIGQGVKETNLRFDPVSTTTLKARDHRGYTTSKVTGYEVYQYVRFSTNKMEIAENVAATSSDLISQGIQFVSHQPMFYYTKLDDLKVEMLGAATKNAYQRAQSMAKSTNRSVGQLENANMGVFQITAENSTDVSDYGISDTSSRMKKITAVVNATFEIKN